MKFTSTKTQYNLIPESVDAVSEKVGSFLGGLKIQRKNIIATRLTVEEILLDLMEKYGAEKEFTFTESRFLGKPYISVSFSGEQFNPLEKEEDDEFGNWSSSLVRSTDYTPSYSFEKGFNTVTIRFPARQINPIITLALTIVLAVLVSLLKPVLPTDVIHYLKDSVLTPFYNAFLGLMTTVEIPLVFLSVACGIIGIGDSAVFGKIGRKMVMQFVGIILLMTGFAGIVFSLYFTRFGQADGAGISLKVGIDMLLKLIPQNLIAPIVDGNTMQVVLMAVFVGIALVILGDKTKTISGIMNEGNTIIVYITGLFSKLLPVFIFIVLLNNMWSGNLHIFIGMWKPVCAFAAMILWLALVYILVVAFKEKVSPALLIKKTLPTFLIGLGTSSSIAANGESSDTLNRRLGVRKKFVDFGQPVGGVIFMPSTAINFLVCAIYMASYYDVEVSLLWFIIAVLICTFVAVATPPVPGGAIAAYTIIFSQLGIPAEAVTIVVTLDILFDIISTGFDGLFLQLELVRQAEKYNMLDKKTLEK